MNGTQYLFTDHGKWQNYCNIGSQIINTVNIYSLFFLHKELYPFLNFYSLAVSTQILILIK